MTGRDSLERRGALSVTDRAVVITLRRMRESQQRDHILVTVVWKLDRELQIERRISEWKPCLITRRRLRVTHGTDLRSRTAEELRPMTTHTRIVTWIIIDIRKLYLVTRITRRPMFLRRV